MILLLIVLLFTLCYCGLFYLTGLSLWFYFLWTPISLILAVITLVLIVEVILLICQKTPPTGKFRHWLLRQVTKLILVFSNIKLEIIGKENIPNNTFVCYSNHKSNYDPVILYVGLNSICSAVGKETLFKSYFMRQLSTVFGAVPINRDNDREAAKSIIKAIKLVKSGLSMIIFPEGGIKSKETEEMVNLRAGAYKLVTKSEADLLPVTIMGNTKIKNASVFKKAKVKLIIHPAFKKEDYQNLTTQEIGLMVQNIINGDIHDATI